MESPPPEFLEPKDQEPKNQVLFSSSDRENVTICFDDFDAYLSTRTQSTRTQRMRNSIYDVLVAEEVSYEEYLPQFLLKELSDGALQQFTQVVDMRSRAALPALFEAAQKLQAYYDQHPYQRTRLLKALLMAHGGALFDLVLLGPESIFAAHAAEIEPFNL